MKIKPKNIMENFSDLILSEEKAGLRKQINSLRKNMDSLKNKGGEYYEHHQHLINVFNEMLVTVDCGLADSHEIGKGL